MPVEDLPATAASPYAARSSSLRLPMSLMLVTAAGLFLRSFASLNQLPLGFVPEPLLVAELNLQASDAPIEQRGARAERLRAAAAAVPGVRSASLSRVPLLTGGGWGANRVAVDDGPMPVEDLSANRLWRNATTPGWFDTMGTPLVNGRDFTDADRVGAPLVAIVNHAFVRRYQLGQQPIGRTVRIGLSNGETALRDRRGGWRQRLYVAARRHDGHDVRAARPGRATRGNRHPDHQRGSRPASGGGARGRCRTRADRAGDCVRLQDLRSVHRRDGSRRSASSRCSRASSADSPSCWPASGSTASSRKPCARVRPRSVFAWRLERSRLGSCVSCFVALACWSSSGSRSDWQAASGRRSFVGPLLFQVEARDPATFAGAAGVLVAAGVLAAWLPARRAARLDPATVLREG